MSRVSRTPAAVRFLLAGLVGLTVLVIPAGVPGGDFAPEPTVTNAGLVALVQKRLREWQPRREERRLDEIGWVRNILDAERLGREHGRPVFLFTLDGRMDVGRC
jgi:hypothetical protein